MRLSCGCNRTPERGAEKHKECRERDGMHHRRDPEGRTVAELHQVMEWLTGFTEQKTQQLLADKVTFEEFFKQATLNPNAHLITGLICGYRVEEIENPLTQKVRYLDKLIDELAKGKKMEKVLRG